MNADELQELKQGCLYVVGTPIGNLEDMTFRAVKVLEMVDVIAAEDTRHTGKLLQHFQVTTPQISYHDHNRFSRSSELLEQLKQGKNIALVTDAGMPCISDPGYDLVKVCIEEGISVIPIPGVTAGVTALAVSGLATDKFVFEGFLPAKGKDRIERLNFLKDETRTLIFYESPHRLQQTLQDLGQLFGFLRKIVLARELTKLHEQVWRGTLKGAIAFYHNHSPKGEFTLIVEGASSEEERLSEEELKLEIEKLLQGEISISQASRQLAQVTSFSRRKIYQLALEIRLKQKGEEGNS